MDLERQYANMLCNNDTTTTANHSEVVSVMDDLLERIIVENDDRNDVQQQRVAGHNKCNNNLDTLNKMVQDLTQIAHLNKSSSHDHSNLKISQQSKTTATTTAPKYMQQSIQIDRRCQARLSLRNGAPTIVLERRYSFDSKRSSAEWISRSKQQCNSNSSAYESASTNSPVQSSVGSDDTRLSSSKKSAANDNNYLQMSNIGDCLNENNSETIHQTNMNKSRSYDEKEEQSRGDNNGNNNGKECANCVLCQQLRSITVAQTHLQIGDDADDNNQLIRENELDSEQLMRLPSQSHEANSGATMDKQDCGSLTSTMTNSTVANNKFMSSTSSLMVRKGSYDLAQASKCINYSYSSSHLPNDDVNNKRLTLLNEHDASNCDSVIGRCYKSQPNNDGESVSVVKNTVEVENTVEQEQGNKKTAANTSYDDDNNNNKQNVNNKCSIQQQPTIFSMKSLAEYINSNRIEDKKITNSRSDSMTTGVSDKTTTSSTRKDDNNPRQPNDELNTTNSCMINEGFSELLDKTINYNEKQQVMQHSKYIDAYATATQTVQASNEQQQQQFNCICQQLNNSCLYNIAPNLLPPLHLHSILEPFPTPTIALPFDGPPPSNAIRIDAAKLIPIADDSLITEHRHNHIDHSDGKTSPISKHKKPSTTKKRTETFGHRANSTLDNAKRMSPPKTIIASVDHIIEDVVDDDQRQSLNSIANAFNLKRAVDETSRQQQLQTTSPANLLTNGQNGFEKSQAKLQSRRYQSSIDQLTNPTNATNPVQLQPCSQAHLLALPQSVTQRNDLSSSQDHYNNAIYFYPTPRSINHHQIYTMQQAAPYLPPPWTALHYQGNNSKHPNYCPNNLIQQQQLLNSARAVDMINNKPVVNGNKQQMPTKSKGARLFGALPGFSVRMQNNRLLQPDNSRSTDTTNKTTTTNKTYPPPMRPNEVAPNIMFHHQHPATIVQPYHGHNYLFNHHNHQHILSMGEQHHHNHYNQQQHVKSQLNRKQLKRLQRDNLIWVHRDKQRERKVCIGTVSLALIVFLASMLFAIFAIMQFHSTSTVRPLLT